MKQALVEREGTEQAKREFLVGRGRCSPVAIPLGELSEGVRYQIVDRQKETLKRDTTKPSLNGAVISMSSVLIFLSSTNLLDLKKFKFPNQTA